MPYDPFSNLTNPYAVAFGQQRQPNPIQPFSPQEENSALGSVLGSVAGGIGYIGGLLDKYTGARGVRGLLGGNPRELLSVLPGSDVLGITDESQRVSGEDLLKKAGVLEGEGQKGTFEFRDLLGPATEIALDPAAWATFGASALGRGGQIAKAIGFKAPNAAARISTSLQDVLDQAPKFLNKTTAEATADAAKYAAKKGLDLSEHLDKPLGGLMGLGFPFMNPSFTVGGPDALAGIQAMGRGAATAARMVPGVAPLEHALTPFAQGISRGAKALFSPEMMDFGSEAGQKVAPAAFAKEQAYRESSRAWLGQLKDMAPKELLEGNKLGQWYEAGRPAEPQLAKFHDFLTQHYADEWSLLHNEAGIDLGKVEDYIPRKLKQLPDEAKIPGPYKSPIGVGRPGRTELYGDLPQSKIEAMIADEKIDQMKPLEAAAHIREKYLGWTPAHDQELNSMRQLAEAEGGKGTYAARKDELEKIVKKSNALADDIQSMSPERKAAGMYEPTLDSMLSHEASVAKQYGAAMAVHEALANSLVWGKQQIPSKTVPLIDTLKSAALARNVPSALKEGEAPTGAIGKQLKLWMGKNPTVTNQALGAVRPATLEDAWEAISTAHVPKMLADDITRKVRGFMVPEALQPFVRLWRGFTDLFKGLTLSWPSTKLRDLGSQAWQLSTEGAFGLRSQADAFKIIKQGLPEGIERYGLGTGQEALNKIRNLAMQYQIGGQGGLIRAEAPGQEATKFLSQFVGETPRPIWPKEGTWNPLKSTMETLRGEPSQAASTFKPVAAGFNIGNTIFDTTELGGWLHMLEKGYSPDAAAKVVKKAVYQWGPETMTSFEKNVMTQAVPFYSWAKKNIPHQLELLFERPGGQTAQAIRLQENLKGKEEYTPQYLENTLAAPIGKEENGTQRFLTTMGLPFEDLGDFIGRGPNRLADVGMGLLSQLNPAIKGPLEYATGKQFYSGRNLDDLYSTTGSTLADQALMNSPIARFLSAGRTLLDERKGPLTKATNLLSPVKIQDVDMEKQRNQEARRVIDELLKGSPEIGHFQRFSLRPGEIPTPEEVQLLRLQKTLEQDARERKKQPTR